MARRRLGLGSVIRLVVLAYGVGALTVALDLPPAPQVARAFVEVYDSLRFWRNDLGLEPTRFMVEARAPAGDGVLLDPAAAMEGYRLIAGYFRDRETPNGAVLLDEAGEVLHFWPIDTEALGASLHRHTFLHGVEAFPDGSLAIDFDEGEVLARIDACGTPMWTTPAQVHHAVNLYDGELWVPGGADSEDAVSRVDPATGEIAWSKTVEEMFAAENTGILGVRRDVNERGSSWLDDPFHVNDVEVLSAEMAPAFPMFTAGDVMVSMRNLNLVAVLDHDLSRFKWFQHGPWMRQHDPDFTADGRISIFDNAMNTGASRIVSIDPATRELRTDYRGDASHPFYSWIRGKHQALPNGNVLITEPQAGRVFEATPTGRIVWEFQNTYDAGRNLLVSKAIWLRKDFFNGGVPSCDGDTGAAGNG